MFVLILVATLLELRLLHYFDNCETNGKFLHSKHDYEKNLIFYVINLMVSMIKIENVIDLYFPIKLFEISIVLITNYCEILMLFNAYKIIL